MKTSSGGKQSVSLTRVLVALVISTLLVIVGVTVTVITSSKKAASFAVNSGHEKEGFSDGGAFKVLRTSGAVTEPLVLLIPRTEHVSPHQTAVWSALPKLADVGVSIVDFSSSSSAIAPAKTDAKADSTLVVGDALRFWRKMNSDIRIKKRERNEKNGEAVVTVLRNEDKHFCAFGNVSSALFVDPEYEEADEMSVVTLFEAVGRASASRTTNTTGTRTRPLFRLVCLKDGVDEWLLEAVLLASSVGQKGVVGPSAAKRIRRATRSLLRKDYDQSASDMDIIRVETPDAVLRAVRNASDETAVPTLAVLTLSASHPAWKEELENVPTVWYGYENVDHNVMRLRVPICHPGTVDVRQRLLPHVKGIRKTYSVLSVNSIVYGSSSVAGHPMFSAVVRSLVLDGGVEDDQRGNVSFVTTANNFLTYHGLPFFDEAREVMRPVDNEAYKKEFTTATSPLSVGRPKFQVLEQFSEGNGEADEAPITLAVTDEEVRGFHTTLHGGNVKVMTLPSATVRDVALKVGDRINLGGQRRKTENGSYVVVTAEGVSDDDTTRSDERCVMTSPLWVRYGHDPEVDRAAAIDDDESGREGSSEKNDSDVLLTFGGRNDAEGSEEDRRRFVMGLLSEGDGVFVANVGEVGVLGKVRAQKRTVRRKNDTKTLRKSTVILADMRKDGLVGSDDRRRNPYYRCVGAPLTLVPEQCEAEGGSWDRPCMIDAECPYFQTNRKYPNYRGGCVNGHCEMPLGVERVGYRGHSSQSDTSFPLCHGCRRDPFGPGCCRDQAPSPDYAFEMDEYERHLHNMW